MSERHLLERPSDLRFWYPSGIGFLAKEKGDVFQRGEEGGKVQYLVTDEFVVRSGAKEEVYSQLRAVAGVAEDAADVLTFWVQDRYGKNGSSDGGGGVYEVYVLIRCSKREAFETFWKQIQTAWDQISQLVEDRRRTNWVESGIGFLSR